MEYEQDFGGGRDPQGKLTPVTAVIRTDAAAASAEGGAKSVRGDCTCQESTG
jgi:hypothetical protein